MNAAAAAEMTATEITERLTGTQKSAILMMLLGEEEAAEILKNLSPKEVQHLGGAMYSVRNTDQETVNAVLDEFLAIIKRQTSLGLGAGNYIRNVLNRALGEDKAQSVLSRITPASSERPIEILDWMDGRSIAELLQDEHPQIIALIVSYLDYSQASDVLNLLPEDIQPEIVQRIATLETVDPEALRELELVMQMKFKANTSLRSTKVGGVKAAAKIMNFTKANMEKRILGAIRRNDQGYLVDPVGLADACANAPGRIGHVIGQTKGGVFRIACRLGARVPDVVLALKIDRDVRDPTRKGVLVIGKPQPDRGTAAKPMVLGPFIWQCCLEAREGRLVGGA